MTENTYSITLKYTFNPDHKGAPYTLDGVRYMNAGDLHEILVKSCKGLEAVKDGNGAFDVTDDIPELNASVKSGKATLTSRVLGDDFASVKAEYFKAVHSTLWIWAVIIDDTLVTYEMNKDEFSEFIDNWATFASDRKVIRFKTSSSKMLGWLRARV